MRKVLALLWVCLLVSPYSPTQEQSAFRTREESSAKVKAINVKAIRPATNSVEPVQRESSSADGKLPVRRVVLYKNGVGYFEHLGRVRGSQDVHIDFTSAQLNDVLKSLTVLDLAGGRITGVDYNSEAPLARRLATLRLALGEKPSEAEFLGALRGARIEVRAANGAALTGKLLSVERKTRNSANWTVETDEISLISDTGEVRSVDLNPATSVRIVDHDLNAEVGKYLGLVASAREQDVRRMTVSTTGTGDRNLYVSYISEVPIWKTTYRIVLPTKAGKKPLLQGWAIVDNTVGEDWNDVELSLVAGAPHSFIQQLSEPFYGRRPVVPLPESVQLAPQTHASTLMGGVGRIAGSVVDSSGATIVGATVRLMDENSAVVAQTMTNSQGEYSFPDLVVGRNYNVEVQGQGFKRSLTTGLDVAPGDNTLRNQLQVGTVAETVTVTAEASGLNTTSSEVLATYSGSAGKMGVARRARVGSGFGSDAGGGVSSLSFAGRTALNMSVLTPGTLDASREAIAAAANGEELGDLFEYKLKDKVTLRKNQSALVPIAQTEIEAEKVSLWSGGNGSGRPLRGLWLKNTSPLTLDGGSFSVLENEVFAGEGLTDPIKPGERRLVTYASDLGLLVQAQGLSQPQQVNRAKILKGVLTQTSQLRESTTYTVKNQEDGSRTLIIEHPARPEWRLSKGVKEPEERASGMYRFRLEVPAKATASLPVDEMRTLQTTYELSNIDDNQIALFLQQRTISSEMAEELRKITAQKAVVSKLEDEMEARQHDIDRIVDDQARLRDNMKALKGSTEEKALIQRYTRQLDEQETRLDALRKKIEGTEAQRDQEKEKLDGMIADLDLEATL